MPESLRKKSGLPLKPKTKSNNFFLFVSSIPFTLLLEVAGACTYLLNLNEFLLFVFGIYIVETLQTEHYARKDGFYENTIDPQLPSSGNDPAAWMLYNSPC
jgi:hypothetical protein